VDGTGHASGLGNLPERQARARMVPSSPLVKCFLMIGWGWGKMAGEFAALARGGFFGSSRLKKYIGPIAQSAVAVIGSAEGPLVLATEGPPCPAQSAGRVRVTPASCVLGSRPFELGAAEMAGLQRIGPGRSWRGIEFTVDAGPPERLALALDPSEDLRLTTAYLERVWPILREECLREYGGGDAMVRGWDLLDRFDVAVVILDAAGLMYRLNAAARALIDEGRLLRRGKGGLHAAASELDNRRFHAALRRVAAGDGADEVVFLADASGGASHTVVLSRYVHEGTPTRFVVATVPLPPDPERVEELALEMGLTGTEARVARLLQLGLSNREAADRSGLKEETFKTYAKRALSKMKVRGRAEMAQVLTWQAAGRRVP
jgi:DNA-binding NarL/FixJ family response regulator